jgi:hypothetical protein
MNGGSLHHVKGLALGHTVDYVYQADIGDIFVSQELGNCGAHKTGSNYCYFTHGKYLHRSADAD